MRSTAASVYMRFLELDCFLTNERTRCGRSGSTSKECSLTLLPSPWQRQSEEFAVLRDQAFAPGGNGPHAARPRELP